MGNFIGTGIGFLAVVSAFIFWALQFSDLMRRKDDDFPGRYDKPLWGIIIFFGALLGAVFYWFGKPRTSRATAKYGLDAKSKHERDIQFPSGSEDANRPHPDDDAT